MKKTSIATGVVAAGIIGSAPMNAETSPQNDASPNPVSIEFSNGNQESSKLVSKVSVAPRNFVRGDCRYTTDHKWVRADNASICTIGLTDFAQESLGNIVFADVPTLCEFVEEGYPFGSVESVKACTDLIMPLSGEIVDVNCELENNPGLINSDPYGNGWIVKVKMDAPSEFNMLMDSNEYEKYCKGW